MDPFAEVVPSKRPAAGAAPPATNGTGSNHQQQRHYANEKPERGVVFPEKKKGSSSSSASVSAGSSRNLSQSPREPSAASAAAPSLSGPTAAAINATYQKKSEHVFLNVYDLHPYNQYLHGLGFGAYHTAVQIFGREYSFGFHDSADTGVFSMLPKQVPNAVFRETIDAGNIYLTYNQFNLILNQLRNEWRGNKYHLLKRNCNHFSKALLSSLGLKAPSFINRLASAGDALATIVPSFMLPKQVNMLIKDGRPDMGSDDSETLANVPSGHSGGVPTLSSNYGSNSTGDLQQGDWRQIAPRPGPGGGGGTFNQADELDEESFAEFLRASEREYERSEQLKKLHEQTRRATEEDVAVQEFQARMRHSAKAVPCASSAHLAASPDKQFSDCEGSRTEHERGSYTNVRKSPQVPRVTNGGSSSATPVASPALALDQEARIEAAMRDFALPPNVSEEERSQIRAVLRMSMNAQ